MKTHKYLVNLDAIYQELDDNQYQLVEDFTDCGASEFVEDCDINLDAFDIVFYPIDLLDEQLRMDAYAIRIGIEEICQESPIHCEAMGIS